MAQYLYDLKINPKNIIILDTDKWYDFKLFKCKLSPTNHDVPNVAIHIEINGEKLIYATDTSSLDNVDAKYYDYYLIEGNYKEEELEKRKEEKMANGEFVIEDRIKNSHLSYEQCIKYFLENSKESSVLEVMHQHREKN